MSTSMKNSFESTQARPDTVTDIVGLDVYTEKGVYIGEVGDVRLNFNQNSSTGIALKNINPELSQYIDNNNEGVVIPYTWLTSVHDIVVTIDFINRLNHTQ